MRTYKDLRPLHSSAHKTGSVTVFISAWNRDQNLTVGASTGPNASRSIDVTPTVARQVAHALLAAADAIENQESQS